MVLPVFRTDSTAYWGTGQGYNLTAYQIDFNFWGLHDRVLTIEENPTPGRGIDTFTVSGNQLTVVMDDSTEEGPYTLPTSAPRLRGAWAPATAYYKWDIVRVAGLGAYFVLQNHTSAGSFDPDEGNSVGNYYQIFYSDPDAPPVNTITAATATVSATHIGKYNRCTNNAGCAVTINSSTFAVGQEAHFVQRGTSPVEILAGDTGVSFSAFPGFLFETADKGSVITVKCVATNTFDIFGRLAVDASA